MCVLKYSTCMHFFSFFSNQEQQLARLMERDSITKEDALKRISSQMPLSDKCKMSDFVIDNTTDRRFTEQQTYSLYHNMRRISFICGLYRWLTVITVLCLCFIIIFTIKN